MKRKMTRKFKRMRKTILSFALEQDEYEEDLDEFQHSDSHTVSHEEKGGKGLYVMNRNRTERSRGR
jgi:hypothetical protein